MANTDWLGRTIGTSEGSLLPWIWEFGGTEYIQVGYVVDLPRGTDLHDNVVFSITTGNADLRVKYTTLNGWEALGDWSGYVFTAATTPMSFASVIKTNGDLEIYFMYNNGYPESGYAVATYNVPYEDVAERWFEIPDREWDESPSLDPENDPFNELPTGGEYADREDFGETFIQTLSDLLEPETFNYGSFLTAYELYPAEMQAIGTELFNTNFWTSLKNKFQGLSDPLSMIISAVEIPFALGVAPTTFKLGGIELEDSNGNPIHCSKHVQRYLKNSFGTINLKEVWGTAKDYTDCDIAIYLPYVGMRSIDPDLGVNAALTLGCIVDVWTGDINYMLEINNSNNSGKYFASSGIPYRWSGNCGNHVPIGKVDPSTPILNVAASLGTMALGAGVIAATGGVGAGAAAAGALTGASAGAGSLAGGIGGAMIASSGRSLLEDINTGFNPIAQSSGNLSGAVGYLDFQYPYLVIKRGVPVYPKNWREEFGAPRYQEFTISDLTGYTEFAEIHADEVNGASDEEKTMIEEMLRAGIII